MRRPLTVAIAAALLAACSSGGDQTPDTTGPAETTAPSQTPPQTAPPATSEAAEPAPEPTPTTEPVDTGPELPGLLDPNDEAIPDDEAVRTGELANGLRYYVRSNDNPGAKADLRLAVRAGSADEFGPSTGLAHFVEHMLFNGTEEFPENELIDVLRSFGASFGPDINAYTSFDETVYSLVVPNDDQTVELGLDVLQQWLSAATFDPDQVVAERGVVLDEWRVRTQTAGGRLFEIAADMYLAGTPYDGRLTIGSDASISAMGDVEMREFYDAWYRPDNVALIVVGDIDVDAVEADIQRLFGDVEPRSDELRARADRSFETSDEADFRLHADPDQQTVDVEVTLPLPAFRGSGTAALRAGFIDQMVFDILVERLQLDVAAGTAPFDDVTPGSNSFVDDLDAPALYAFTDADRVRPTLTALLDEYERADQFGFTAAELDRARESIAAFYRTRYDGRESTQDSAYADQYVEHFLRDAPYPSIDVEFEIVTAVLDAITPEALDLRFRARWANSAPHVIISVPEAQADLMPSADEVLDIVEATGSRPVEPRAAARDLPESPMDRPDGVEPLSITKVLSSGYPFFDPVEVTYPNGVRVILNPNEIVTGQWYLQASSPGGSSLVADADVPDALYAADIVTASGVAEFNQAELAQILAGDDVEVYAWIDPYTENFGGSGATADAETAFQLMHLYMTDPRVDQVAVNQTIAAERPVVADPSIDPQTAEYDALVDLRYGGEPRYTVLPSVEEFDTLDSAGVERVWNERYGDAGDWVFVLSGDFDIDTMIDLASSYLGTLPGTDADEQPIDVEPDPPSAIVTTTITAGSGDTASLSMLFDAAVPSITADLWAHTELVTNLLGARLTDVIREEYGDTYSPFAISYFAADPDPIVETYINVSGSPDRIEQIGELVIGEIDELIADGPTPDEFASALAETSEQYNFVDNGQMLDALISDALDPEQPVENFIERFFALDGVSEASVQEYFAEYVSTGAFIEVVAVPRG